jgi:hypothetical protein
LARDDHWPKTAPSLFVNCCSFLRPLEVLLRMNMHKSARSSRLMIRQINVAVEPLGGVDRSTGKELLYERTALPLCGDSAELPQNQENIASGTDFIHRRHSS